MAPATALLYDPHKKEAFSPLSGEAPGANFRGGVQFVWSCAGGDELEADCGKLDEVWTAPRATQPYQTTL